MKSLKFPSVPSGKTVVLRPFTGSYLPGPIRLANLPVSSAHAEICHVCSEGDDALDADISSENVGCGVSYAWERQVRVSQAHDVAYATTHQH